VISADAGSVAVVPAARRFAVPAWWWVPAALVLSGLTWPVSSLSAAAPRVESWSVGLHMAAAQGLDAGHDVVFTYGPLGFLAYPLLVTSATAIASFAFAVVVHAALVTVVLRTALRRLPWPAALAVAAVAGAAAVPLADVPVLLVLAGCLRTLEADEPAGGALLVALGGAVAACELLVKLNDGIVCMALAALAAWRLRPRRLRAELLLAGSFVASLAVLWRLTGSPLRDLPTWLRLCAHLLVSYAQGMGTEGSNVTLAAGVLLLCSLVVVALIVARPLGRARGIATFAAVLVFAFAFFKEGFVRADATHSSAYFADVAVALLLVAQQTALLRATALLLAAAALERAGSHGPAVAGVAVVLAGWTVLHGLRPRRPLYAAPVMAVGCAALAAGLLAHGSPLPVPWQALSQLRVLASGGRRAAAVAAAKASVRSQARVPATLVAELRGHTVDVEPYGATIAWAYGFDWRPEPMLESYAAFDPALDAFAARALASSGAARILQRPGIAVNWHNPIWEAPALVLTEICDYRRLAGGARFDVLARATDRCGSPHLLSSTVAGKGAWVSVPAGRPHELVYASIRIRGGLGGAVRSLLLRPPPVWIDVRGRNTRGYRFKLVPATATGPLVMRAPQLASLPHDVDGTAIDRFRLDGVSAQVDFYAVALRGQG